MKPLRKAAFASLFLLMPFNCISDYHSNITLERTLEKDEINMQIRHDIADGKKLRESVYEAFVEEKRYGVENSSYMLLKESENLIKTHFSEYAAITSLMNSIFKLKIPARAFAIFNLEPKFFVLQQNCQTWWIADRILEKSRKIENGREPEYYTQMFGELSKIQQMLDINAEFTADVSSSSAKQFWFTKKDKEKLEDYIHYWNIKGIVNFISGKYYERKEFEKIAEEQSSEITETKEYKKYIRKMGQIKKENLYQTVSQYPLIRVPSEKIKDKESGISLWHESTSNFTNTENIKIRTKIERTKINDDSESIKLWLFSKEWDSEKGNFYECYFIKIPEPIFILHPKRIHIDNIVEKSYEIFPENGKMAGDWKWHFPKEEKEILKDKLRIYVLNKMMFDAVKYGWKTKARNLFEGLIAGVKYLEDIKDEKEEKEFHQRFGDGYDITEIKLSDSKQKTAQYISFSLNNIKKKDRVYIAMLRRIEKGTHDNFIFGDMKSLISLNPKYREDMDVDLNLPEDKKAYEAISEFNQKPLEQDKGLLERVNKEISDTLKYNPQVLEYRLLELDKTDSNKATAVMGLKAYYTDSLIPKEMTHKVRINLEKRIIDGEYKWTILKSENFDVEIKDMFR